MRETKVRTVKEFSAITSNPNWINEVIEILRPIIDCSPHIKDKASMESRQLIYELAKRGVSRITPAALVGMYLKLTVSYHKYFCELPENRIQLLCDFVEQYPQAFQWFSNHAICLRLFATLAKLKLPYDPILPEFFRRLRRLHHEKCAKTSLLHNVDFPDTLELILKSYADIPEKKRVQFMVGLAMGLSIKEALKFDGSVNTLKTAVTIGKNSFRASHEWLSISNPRLVVYVEEGASEEAMQAAMKALHQTLSHPKAAHYALVLSEVIWSLMHQTHCCTTVVELIIDRMSLAIYRDVISCHKPDKLEKLTLRQLNDIIEKKDLASLWSLNLHDSRESDLLVGILGLRPLPETDEPVVLHPYVLVDLRLR